MLGTIVSEIVPISNGYCFCNVFFLTSYIISFFMPFLFWGIALQWQMYCSLILLLVLAFHIPISQQICIHLVTRKQVMCYVVVTFVTCEGSVLADAGFTLHGSCLFCLF